MEVQLYIEISSNSKKKYMKEKKEKLHKLCTSISFTPSPLYSTNAQSVLIAQDSSTFKGSFEISNDHPLLFFYMEGPYQKFSAS